MLRNEFPRVFELRDLIEEPNAPTAYFKNFDISTREEPLRERFWLSRELEFQRLDTDSWKFLKNKARHYLTKGQPNGRGWEQLIGALNEARGFIYLSDIGCSDVQFIPEINQQGINRPDVQGNLDSAIVLCEVKSLFISDFEVECRREGRARTIEHRLPDGFLMKLKSAIDKAKGQIEAYKDEKYESAENVRRIVCVIPNFDDILGEYKVTYYQQIDQYLGIDPTPEIEIVFYNEQTCFHWQIVMSNATVINPHL